MQEIYQNNNKKKFKHILAKNIFKIIFTWVLSKEMFITLKRSSFKVYCI